MDPIVQTLREARRRSGLSQEQVAELVGTSQSAVSELETGVIGPRLSTARRWADALGYDLALVKREGG
jgi:transcriptional regulator with XRE-family HTH domain